MGFCSDLELLKDERKAQSWLLKFWDLKVDSTSPLFFSLTAAATLLHNITLERGERKRRAL